MSELRPAHTIWLMRRAAVLEGASIGATGEPLDPARAEIFHRIVAKVSRALAAGTSAVLTPEERTALAAEADELANRAARELRRPANRDLARGEEWVLAARALREVAEATADVTAEARPPSVGDT